jgi:outer membrane protein assembly factor BamB
VIPSGSALEVIDAHGRISKSIDIKHSVRSPLTGAGNVVYCGLDYGNGGRLAKVDLNRSLNNVRWELLTSAGISAAPVLFQNVIYVAAEDGRVYAVNEDRAAVWPLVNGYFQTEGRVVADLKADDSGLYVASMDTKLYCLDRASAKIRWQFYAGLGLSSPPVLTRDSVYQMVPDQGVAALDKNAGAYVRKPRWIAPGTIRFLAEDAEFAFLATDTHGIIGVDKKTGQVKLHSKRNDFTAFVSNPTGTLAYAATADGVVIAVQPVSRPGVVGQVVMGGVEFERVAAVGR